VNLSDELARASRGAPNEADQTLQVARLIPLTGANPTRGTIALNQDGTITYTAPAGYEGVDAFDYEVVDNGTTEGVADPKRGIARVTINVVPFAPSRIEGKVWIDDNNNGRYDVDELVLNDIEIKIASQSTGGNLRTSEVIVETDASGRYSLEQLPPGQYTITMMRPEFMIDAPEV
ncbi:MAG: SdrD B-like domain-containing protein, partial [Pirellulaceae bacterium]